MQTLIIIFLFIIIIMMLAGGYFFFSGLNAAAKGHSDNGASIRIVGSEKSIVSVRKVSGTDDYEVRVEEVPYIDAYAAGEFLDYEETPIERWQRDDISDEERRLLKEQIFELYGLRVIWDDPDGASEAQEVDKDDDQEEDDAQEEEQKGGRVNAFDYDPFENSDYRDFDADESSTDEEEEEVAESVPADESEALSDSEDMTDIHEPEDIPAIIPEDKPQESESKPSQNPRPKQGYDWGNLGF